MCIRNRLHAEETGESETSTGHLCGKSFLSLHVIGVEVLKCQDISLIPV